MTTCLYLGHDNTRIVYSLLLVLQYNWVVFYWLFDILVVIQYFVYWDWQKNNKV